MDRQPSAAKTAFDSAWDVVASMVVAANLREQAQLRRIVQDIGPKGVNQRTIGSIALLIVNQMITQDLGSDVASREQIAQITDELWPKFTQIVKHDKNTLWRGLNAAVGTTDDPDELLSGYSVVIVMTAAAGAYLSDPETRLVALRADVEELLPEAPRD